MKFETINHRPNQPVKKLQLKKETIRVLQGAELSQVGGGASAYCTTTTDPRNSVESICVCPQPTTKH